MTGVGVSVLRTPRLDEGDGGSMEQRECGGGVPRLPGELAGGEWSRLGMRPPRFPSPTLLHLWRPPAQAGEMGWGCSGAVRLELAKGDLMTVEGGWGGY